MAENKQIGEKLTLSGYLEFIKNQHKSDVEKLCNMLGIKKRAWLYKLKHNNFKQKEKSIIKKYYSEKGVNIEMEEAC
jgi:hypothetical protein